jgi:hypothetical protein
MRIRSTCTHKCAFVQHKKTGETQWEKPAEDRATGDDDDGNDDKDEKDEKDEKDNEEENDAGSGSGSGSGSRPSSAATERRVNLLGSTLRTIGSSNGVGGSATYGGDDDGDGTTTTANPASSGGGGGGGGRVLTASHWEFLEEALSLPGVRALTVVSHSPFVWSPRGSRTDVRAVRKHDDKVPSSSE